MVRVDNHLTCIILFFKLLIPIVLLISGVALFVSEVSFLGILLGLPLIIIGSVLVIYTYDEICGMWIGDSDLKDKDEQINY